MVSLVQVITQGYFMTFRINWIVHGFNYAFSEKLEFCITLIAVSGGRHTDYSFPEWSEIQINKQYNKGTRWADQLKRLAGDQWSRIAKDRLLWKELEKTLTL